MSQTIDQRVVEMRFDNRQFESGAATTLTTLQKLKNSLDFSKINSSFDNINKASSKVDMNGLDQAITGVQNKFSALEVIAITALSNITNSIVNSAKRWISAFTIDQVKSGFQEYETQINAVQTILANTQKEGTKIKDVNAALDELNLYADKTIYNFTEMTRNIGTFTAAGVDLKTSVSAIQGIANLAAVSGSNSQQASTAMYQLSQALAAGTVKLQDWNSVVNAGMGGQLFQDALLETSKLLGTGADEAIKAEGSFRESLKAGWLTSQVLTETLKKFTTSGAAEYVANFTGLSKEAIEAELELAKSTYGEADAIDKAAESLAKKSGKNKDEIAETLRFAQTAEDAATKVKTFSQLIDTLKEGVQSGWSQSFRIIIGDFEEAKELFTEISDAFGAVISASADARNKLLADVFNKKDAEDYLAAMVDVPKEAITQLGIVAKEAGTTSDLFKDTLGTFTQGDETLNSVVTHMIEMMNSEQGVLSYISRMSGISMKSIIELQKIGQDVGYTSDQFQDLAETLTKGDPVMKATITNLLQIHDAVQKPSGRELLIDALRNAMKGLVSVVKPIQEAFREVFPPATADQIYGILEAIHNFSKGLILGEKSSENLKNAFKGLFNVIKLIRDGFLAVLKAIIPVELPIRSIGGAALQLAGNLGNLLTKFTESVRSSEKVRKVFELLERGAKNIVPGFKELIKMGKNLAVSFYNMESTQRIIRLVVNAFEDLSKKAGEYISKFVDKVNDLLSSFSGFEDLTVQDILNSIKEAFSNFSFGSEIFNFEKIGDILDKVRSKIKAFSDLLMSNEGFASFVEHIKEYFAELKEAFTLDNLLDRVEKVMSVFGKFFKWVKDTLGPVFKDFDLGTATAATGGLGIVFALIKMAKGFEGISGAFEGVSDVLGEVKDTLSAYQKNLKADTLLKIAASIAVLAAAITLLSFADMERAQNAAIMLGVVGVALVAAVGYFINAVNKANSLDKAAKILAKAGKNISKAIKWKAIGSAVKNFALSVAIIAGSIIALGYMWSTDSEAFNMAVKLVMGIGTVLVALTAFLAIASKLGDTKGMKSIGSSILSMSASLGLVILAVSKLMKMELPEDYKKKFVILGGIFAAFSVLALSLSGAARLAGGNELPKMASTIKSLAVLLVATVLSMKMLFKMELPEDYIKKLGILAGIFVAFGALMVTLGAAAKLAGGNGLKAAGSILAMCVFLATVVAALFVLTIVPWDKLLVGAGALTLVLAGLAAALYGAGNIKKKDNYKSILMMAVTVGTVTAALAVLATVPWTKLLKSSVFLGALLKIVAADFQSVSKVKKNAWITVLAMVGVIATITGSLYILSEQPWKGLLAGALGLGAVLLALSKVFETISNSEEIKIDKILLFLTATLSLAPIGAALYFLSTQPWEGLLASAVALSGVSLALAGVFKIMSDSNVNVTTIGAFVAGAIACIPIAYAMNMLQDNGEMIKTAAALAIVSVSLAAALSLMSAVGAGSLSGVVSFVAAAVACIPIAYAMNMLSGLAWNEVAVGLVTLAGALTIIGVAGVAFGAISAPMIAGAAALGVFSIAVAAAGVAVVVFVGSIATAIGLLGQLLSGLGNLADYSTVGWNLVQGFIQGIVAGFSSAVATVKEFGNGIIDSLKDVLRIHSPSEVMRQLGIYTDEGFALGIGDGSSTINDAMNNVFGNLTDQIDISQFNLAGADSSENFSSGFSNQGSLMSAMVSGVMSNVSSSIDTSVFGTTGDNAANEMMQGFGMGDFSNLSAAMSGISSGIDTSSFMNTGVFAGMDFSSGFESMDIEGLSASISGISSGIDTSSFMDTGNLAGEELVTGFSTGITNQQESLNSTAVSLCDTMVTTLNSNSSNIQNAGENVGNVLCEGIKNGVSTKQPYVLASETTLATNMINTMKNTLPVSTFQTIGQNAIQGLINGVNNKKPLVLSTIKNLCTAIINQFKVSLPQSTFNTIGQNVVQGIINGMNAKKPTALATVRTICTAIINQFKSGLPESTFRTLGENVINWIIKGMESKKSDIESSANKICKTVVDAFRSSFKESDFREIGENAALGLKKGIESKTKEISDAAIKAANDAVRAAKAALDEHSPSRVMAQVGEFFSIGLANGIIDQIKVIRLAGMKAADEAVEPVKQTVDNISSIMDAGYFDMDPVIRPTIDLTEVQRGASEIGSLMNQTYDLSSLYSKVMDTSASFGRSRKSEIEAGPVKTTPEGNVKYEFNQYNTSPKALSRSEIYRQTNNQFSAFRRVVNAR